MEATAKSNTYIDCVQHCYKHCAFHLIYPKKRCCNYIHFTKQEIRGKEKRDELPKDPLLKTQSAGKNQSDFFLSLDLRWIRSNTH